jgi:segregation and condensation protein A
MQSTPISESSVAHCNADDATKLAPSEFHLLGKTLDKMPKDLYIPPEALHIFMDTFQGPLDLLLYLIKKQNLDILNIPIAEITRQYVGYIEIMKSAQIELAAEYMVMAAMLAEIKSRLLLPRVAAATEDGEEEDPRAELVRRLQEYERFKNAATALRELPQYQRDTFPALADKPNLSQIIPAQPDVSMQEILGALKQVMLRVKLNKKHSIKFEKLSVRERMGEILQKLNAIKFTAFSDLFNLEEGKIGQVVTFMAILELLRQARLELVQAEPFAEIYIKMKGNSDNE